MIWHKTKFKAHIGITSKLSFNSTSLGFSILIIYHLIPNARLWIGMGLGNMLGHTEPIHYGRNVKKNRDIGKKKRWAPGDDGLDNRGLLESVPTVEVNKKLHHK